MDKNTEKYKNAINLLFKNNNNKIKDIMLKYCKTHENLASNDSMLNTLISDTLPLSLAILSNIDLTNKNIIISLSKTAYHIDPFIIKYNSIEEIENIGLNFNDTVISKLKEEVVKYINEQLKKHNTIFLHKLVNSIIHDVDNKTISLYLNIEFNNFSTDLSDQQIINTKINLLASEKINRTNDLIEETNNRLDDMLDNITKYHEKAINNWIKDFEENITFIEYNKTILIDKCDMPITDLVIKYIDDQLKEIDLKFRTLLHIIYENNNTQKVIDYYTKLTNINLSANKLYRYYDYIYNNVGVLTDNTLLQYNEEKIEPLQKKYCIFY